jgi:hypothetical protein
MAVQNIRFNEVCDRSYQHIHKLYIYKKYLEYFYII